MREKLNGNPVAQVVLVGVLVVVGVFFFINSSRGSEEGEEAPASEVATTATASGSSPTGAAESLTAGATAPVAAPPASVPSPSPPKRLTAAYESGKTVALLIVHPGSIDSVLSARSSLLLAHNHNVLLFIVRAKEIARYAAITVGLEVNRVPALIVMKPKRLSSGTPQASISYGFQTPQSVLQAVLDAGYRGREVTYHPN
jgi:hypothetical protein